MTVTFALALADLQNVDSNTITALIGTGAGMGVIVTLAGVWKWVVDPSLQRSREYELQRLSKSVDIEREQTKQTENLRTLGDTLADIIKDHDKEQRRLTA